MRTIAFVLTLATLAMAGTSGLAAAQSLMDKAKRDETMKTPLVDPEMEAAMRKARATLPNFFSLASAPRPSMKNFAIKVGVPIGPGHEYFWIRPFQKNGDKYSGQLRNTPREVKNLKFGDTITFTEKDIVDWTYLDGDKTKGNFTACVLIKRAPKAEAEAFKKQYSFECE